MGETHRGPALVSHRDGVTKLIDAGEPFGDPRLQRVRAHSWRDALGGLIDGS
jgi:hypothetical protein